MRGRTARILAGISLAAVGLNTETTSARTDDTPTARALRFFQALPVGDIRDAIAPFRPERITTDQLNAALYRLPAQGELIPDAQEVAKLAQLDALFAYYSRLGVVVTKVVDLPRARIGLYARSILLVSRPALNLLTAVELQAVAAHELGHEYFWDDYYHASALGDTRALQEVELKCDGLAALALVALGLNVGALESGLRRMVRFNEALGATANAAAHPDVDQRARFVRAVLAIRRDRHVHRERDVGRVSRFFRLR